MTPQGPAAGKFTLIVPTYNRPVELSRLLGYLARQRPNFPVLVLDSSEPSTQQANKAAAAKLDCDIRVKSFEQQIPPWEKFWRGSEMVETDYCSLCADDDLVMVESLDRIVEFLETHPDHSVAHGWYFTFYDNEHVGITTSVYRGASLDGGDSLERLFALFRNYEAVTYGVYRTGVMRSVMRDVQGVDSMLAKELLGGALTITGGKSARLPIFYYGRSHTLSHPYTHWHPLDYLASSPDGLYRDYAAYRRVLLESIKSAGYVKHDGSEIATLIDLIHFRYLADYVKPRVMDYLTEQVMARTPKQEIMQGLWSVLARENERSFVGALSGNLLVRKLRDRFFPRFKTHHLRRLISPAGHRKIRSTTVEGRQREYLFYKEFLDSLAAHSTLERDIGSLVRALDNY